MAMKQLTKTCPHCGKVYEQRTIGTWGRKASDEDRLIYGSPLKVCPHCKKLFMDNDCRELAITKLRKQDTEVVTASTKMLLVVGILLAALMYICGQTAFCAVSAGVAVAYLIMDIAFYPGRMKKLEQERIASKKRLSDPGYAQALKNAGFDIPDNYLIQNKDVFKEEKV